MRCTATMWCCAISTDALLRTNAKKTGHHTNIRLDNKDFSVTKRFEWNVIFGAILDFFVDGRRFRMIGSEMREKGKADDIESFPNGVLALRIRSFMAIIDDLITLQ